MDYRAKDGEMRRVHRETVDVLARFGRDGRLEPCVVVLKDCRAFRIDEALMASGFGPVHHGKRTARFDIRLGGRKRSWSWSISWKTPPRVRRAPRVPLELRHLAGATGVTGAAAYRVRLTPRRCSASSGRGKICAPCMI